MEAERDPEVNQDDLPNIRGEDVPQLVAVANGSTRENNEASSSCCSPLPLSNLSATERALQNPLILQNLFQLCPASIVASCRLVSKQWYDESLTSWRSAFPLTLGMQEMDIFFVHRGQNYCSDRPPPLNELTPLREFLEFCDQPENQCSSKPHRNITVRECSFCRNAREFDRFWNEIGRNLTTLNLSHCKFAYVVQFRQIIYKHCPLLQKLEIFLCEMFVPNTFEREQENELEYKEPIHGEHKHLKTLSVSYGGIKPFPVSWMELFSHFSCLTSFKLTKYRDPYPEFETFVKVIKEIRKTGQRKLPFKRFQLNIDPQLAVSRDPASHRKFAMIKELLLPLTRLPIEVHPELDQSFLRNTLEDLAPSVNWIRIYPGQNTAPENQVTVPLWFQNFPFGIQMNNLTTLEFEGDLCDSFTFLKYAPNLATLFISAKQPPEGVTRVLSVTGAIVNTCTEELANLKMVRLTELRLDYNVSSNDLRHLVNWMPNIMYLEMVLNNEQFGIVCQNWKSLRSLTLSGSELLTELGIRPHIANANIEYLESLVVKINLTPESVCHLFLHLPNLQKLTFYDRLKYGSVEREELDLSAYQRAIEENVLERWIAGHEHMLR